jgi:hypothetical protein
VDSTQKLLVFAFMQIFELGDFSKALQAALPSSVFLEMSCYSGQKGKSDNVVLFVNRL